MSHRGYSWSVHGKQWEVKGISVFQWDPGSDTSSFWLKKKQTFTSVSSKKFQEGPNAKIYSW